MHSRYIDTVMAEIWSDQKKLALWQETELCVLKARAEMHKIPFEVYEKISGFLMAEPIDLKFWQERDAVIHHDLNAFLEERKRHLPPELRRYFHDGMTSYDTEEAAFARTLDKSLGVVLGKVGPLERFLGQLAIDHRQTVMMGKTHGQEAELMTFGRRVLSWLAELKNARLQMEKARNNLSYSKLSGAIGNYSSISPDLEKRALELVGSKSGMLMLPFVGATQIMPRSMYVPLASSLATMVCVLAKIANDIRLMARTPNPLVQEPFGKKQKGSSAMPHKKNTISSEQMEGMARMAKGYFQMVLDNVFTWEERAIEQSCVERVAWPDLFHVALRSLKVMSNVIFGLRIYPKNMLREVLESAGCYASAVAKEVLKELGEEYNLGDEDAYRIVQLAAFNARGAFSTDVIGNLEDSESWAHQANGRLYPESIRLIIAHAHLTVSSQLEADQEQVDVWNQRLSEIFSNEDNCRRWERVFSFSYLLRHEQYVFENV